jgi:hypothetical protein
LGAIGLTANGLDANRPTASGWAGIGWAGIGWAGIGLGPVELPAIVSAAIGSEAAGFPAIALPSIDLGDAPLSGVALRGMNQRLQHKPMRRGLAALCRHAQKIRATFEAGGERRGVKHAGGAAGNRPADPQADSRLRPLARRLASTLRPPTVAMRERNPWRRLRTSFDGW